MMRNRIEESARRALAMETGWSPIEKLVLDDEFCHLLISHRMGQGLCLPDQNPQIDTSRRLAWLHASASGENLDEAREDCDRVRKAQQNYEKISATSSDKELVEMFRQSFITMAAPQSRSSYWSGVQILMGSDRILEPSHPLFEPKTTAEKAIAVVMGLIDRRPDRTITISDHNPVTDALGFIRVGQHPQHFGFPETASPKAGTNAGVYHYEIDHPGGAFAFFNQLEMSGGPLGKLVRRVTDSDPLYINYLNQMMARNSLYLQTMGIFHVPAGDTQVTLLTRNGIMAAAVGHDQRAEADLILKQIAERGAADDMLASLSPWLRKIDMGKGDYDWDAIERAQEDYPDLLGHAGMHMDCSYILGAPRAALLELATGLHKGDVGAAEAEVDVFLDRAELVDMPAGRYHLYVPNRSSRSRYDQGLAALSQSCGGGHHDLWFVLADRPIELGDDPHMVTTMRRLPETGLEPMPGL